MQEACDLFIQHIDALIQSKHLLKHDFYQAWSRGELSMECLKEYAKEYYHHVKAFPTYLSAIHCRSEEPLTRRILLQNLIEEEGGSPNHPDLWKKFVLSLGVSVEELENHCPTFEMRDLISCFRQICYQHEPVEGIAALYAYESQIPDICISKIEGLTNHYNTASILDWEYFSVHIEADKQHADQEKTLLKSYLNDHNIDRVSFAVKRILDTLWNFLSRLCMRFKIAAAC